MSKGKKDQALYRRITQLNKQLEQRELELDQALATVASAEARAAEEAERAETWRAAALFLGELAKSLNLQVEQLIEALFASDLECTTLRVALEAALQEVADWQAELARRDKKAEAEAAREAEVARVARLMQSRNWITDDIVEFEVNGIVEVDAVRVIWYPGGDWEEVSNYAGGKLQSRKLNGKGTVMIEMPYLGRMTIDNVGVERTETFETSRFIDFSQEFAFRLSLFGDEYDYKFEAHGWDHADGLLRVALIKVTRQEWCESCQGYHNPADELQAKFVEA